jgi:hypothetical protein
MDAQGTDAGLQAWQEAANYRSAQRSLQGSWIGSLIFGGIALWIGATSLAINPLNGILLILGVCLLVTGLIVLFARKPWAMILEALCLMAIGVWNLFISIPSPGVPPQESGTGFFGMLGLLQIIWGFQGLWRYWERRHLPRQAPPPEALRQLDEMVDAIAKAKPAEHDDMIEFETKTLSGTQNWKARLMHNGAVFVEGPGNDILFCDRSAVTVTDEGKGLLSKFHKARFRLGNRKRTGTIAPEYLQRLADWNNGSMLTTRA